jgi:type II secretory pathway predicted ATPase ExeA
VNNANLRALYGLKYNPFLPALPPEALFALPGVDAFCQRVQAMAAQGGFALITGEPGLGKSKTLQLIAHRLEQVPDLTVRVFERPQSSLGDFYRELGELFNAPMSPANRYGGFKALRNRWKTHCQSTLLRPVLLIDEAQLSATACLTELRLLQSDHFDSQSLLFTILCGDGQLPHRFREADLLPLGSRIGPRLLLTPQPPELLQQYLSFALQQAGCPHLMTAELIRTLATHAANNMRVLNNMAAELLSAAAQRDLTRIEESLFFEIYSPPQSKPPKNRNLKT